MKPMIGLLAEVDDDLKSGVRHLYVAAIEKAGGLPLLLPYVEDDAVIDAFVALCDGFFFTGGMDIDPKRYGEEKSTLCGEMQPHRDDLEFRVIEKVLAADKPIIAVCRGAQLVNTVFGGKLYQDISDETETAILHQQKEGALDFSHEVSILADTPLLRLLGCDRIRVNSFHHQAVKVLGRGLAVMAAADDGMVEAFYAPDVGYLRAYQWHPERLAAVDGYSRMIFEDFINVCKGNEA